MIDFFSACEVGDVRVTLRMRWDARVKFTANRIGLSSQAHAAQQVLETTVVAQRIQAWLDLQGCDDV